MDVLLLEYDLYKSVGGGQTVYKRLIASNPDIDFHYLGRSEPANSARPANAHLVPFREIYAARDLTGEFSDISLPLWAYSDFIESSNVAASVAHLRIDVVDIPDYRICGYFLAPALARHGQASCKIAVALHGNLSETQRVNWGRAENIDLSADQREQWQYRVADIRYGLSRDYLDHWQSIAGKAGHYLHPLRFLAPPRPASWDRRPGGVSLNFIGRTEGFKGPDLFLELLTWLPADSYRVARVIGPSVTDQDGVSSAEHLRRMAEIRGLALEQHACMTTAQLADVFAERSITVLPSRMDTFNLTALESIYAGCPLAVSDQAGVCRFLRETYPGVPFTTLDVERLYLAGPAVQELLGDYDRQRDRLVAAMGKAAPEPSGPTLREIYESGDAPETVLRRRARDLYDRVARFYERHRTPAFQPLTTVGARVWDTLRSLAEGGKAGDLSRETDLWTLYRTLFYIPENTPLDIDKKVELCATISRRSRVDRARLWTELARLERTRGNNFVAATYDIRVLRMMGGDRTGILPVVVSDLVENGFPREAEAVVALYGPEEQRLERGRALLQAAYDDHRQAPAAGSFEWLQDQRDGRTPRVSVIVSLYRAANKLEAFLQMLARQPWVREGLAEVIFVDSHSPTDERQVFERLAPSLGLQAVYARTEARETIQKAWNRGILLSRAPYLVFLGVDEMVRPQCFASLAAELDADPGLDWVLGSSVITEVNAQGTPQRDVMLYQRTPYAQDLAYLETCYLSWVGAMYRRTIHDRFGYYDESFGAAGDTEFKNRVLPFIRTKAVPMTLGVFLNYPEERATQSPRAEVEDLRAWYLHRSEAGVEYAMARRGPEQAMALFQRALGYRKSYCRHLSSDLDFASALARFVGRNRPPPQFAPAAAALERTLRAYRELDWLPELSPRAPQRQWEETERLATAAAEVAQRALAGGDSLAWSVVNDNRYEQHFDIWTAPALAGRSAARGRSAWFRPSLPPELASGSDRGGTPPGSQAASGAAIVRLLAAIQDTAEACRSTGQEELARAIDPVAQYFRALGEGKSPAAPGGDDAGSVLVSVLVDSQLGRPLSRASRFDRRLVDLCALLAGPTRAISPELGDALEGLAVHVGQELEKMRSMEVAARLLTFKSPAEAVARYRSDLSPKVLETLQSAAKSARSKGNSAYGDRLSTYAAAVKGELACV